MPGLAPLIDLLGPVVDGAPLGDGAARLPSPPPAALGAPARQQPPELLGLLPGPVNEGVDGLEGDGAEPALLAALQPAGDLLRRPALEQALADEAAELGVALEDRRSLPALQVAAEDSGTKRNGLSEADLDVPAKLREQRLERGEEAEALPRRQVVREHDLLQLGIPERVEVEVSR